MKGSEFLFQTKAIIMDILKEILKTKWIKHSTIQVWDFFLVNFLAVSKIFLTLQSQDWQEDGN